MYANYVALSYCWGSRPQMRTLKANLQSHLSHIPIEDVSKTCKDSMLVTNGLGYEYLWIDALCIVQDDERQKGVEIAKMDQVYRYAVLTICAEGSPNAHAGLFPETPTDPREVYPCEVTMSVQDEDKTVTRRLTLAGSRSGDDFLSKRGWTLQEEVLTSRALVIGQGITSWRCATASASDTDPVLKPLPHEPFCDDDKDDDVFEYAIQRPRGLALEILRMRKWLYGLPGSHRMDSNHGIDARHPALTAWYTLIEGYSDRELSFVQDTLPAVQGIATVLGSSLGTPYVKGLWLTDLPRGLLWYVAINDERNILDSTSALQDEARDISALNVPSWSWASVGKVRIRFCALRQAEEWTARSLAYITMASPIGTEPQNHCQVLVRSPTQRALLVVDEAFARWRASQTYGNRVACNHEGAYAQLYTKGVHPRFSALIVTPSGIENEIIGEAVLDRPLDNHQQLPQMNSRGINILCLALQLWEAGNTASWACLLLQSTKANGEGYRRLGIGFIQPKNSWEWQKGMSASSGETITVE
ncbi:heterokaryon incompatibility protein-domain-containing protein [Apiospora rasikravindrae]|uniref:Heterokaryon incompatibility protein-domain-containing protein n=1 Tax=Apiospora rasikravindrae TaxID=990691 RepID=A0ABR1TYK4_9PEZI